MEQNKQFKDAIFGSGNLHLLTVIQIFWIKKDKDHLIG